MKCVLNYFLNKVCPGKKLFKINFEIKSSSSIQQCITFGFLVTLNSMTARLLLCPDYFFLPVRFLGPYFNLLGYFLNYLFLCQFYNSLIFNQWIKKKLDLSVKNNKSKIKFFDGCIYKNFLKV